jgi:hypothetical protein
VPASQSQILFLRISRICVLDISHSANNHNSSAQGRRYLRLGTIGFGFRPDSDLMPALKSVTIIRLVVSDLPTWPRLVMDWWSRPLRGPAIGLSGLPSATSVAELSDPIYGVRGCPIDSRVMKILTIYGTPPRHEPMTGLS